MKTLIAAALVSLVATHNADILNPTYTPSHSDTSGPIAAQPVDVVSSAVIDIPATQITLNADGKPDLVAYRLPLVAPLNNSGLRLRADLETDVSAGVAGLDEALRRMPRVILSMAQSVDKHGLAALAYDDPAVKVETDAMSEALGRGIGGIVRAMATDMIVNAKAATQGSTRVAMN